MRGLWVRFPVEAKDYFCFLALEKIKYIYCFCFYYVFIYIIIYIRLLIEFILLYPYYLEEIAHLAFRPPVVLFPLYLWIVVFSLRCSAVSKVRDCKRNRVWVWFPLENEVFNIFTFSLWCLRNSAKRGERSVLTLGALSPTRYMRDTAWRWII